VDNLPPNSPKTKRGANGKFLPKPLLFHLRHPNSKKNQSKFWQILSTKKSFGKTSSALFRHLPEYLEGRTPKKNVLSIFKKNFTPAKSRKQETFFFVVAEALRGGGGTIRAYDLVSSHHARGACALVRLLFEKGSSKVYDYSTTIKRRESGVFIYVLDKNTANVHFKSLILLEGRLSMEFKPGMEMTLCTSGLGTACGERVKAMKGPRYCSFCGSLLNSYNTSDKCLSSKPCDARARAERQNAKSDSA